MTEDKATATLTVEEAATRFERFLEPNGPTNTRDDDEQDGAEFDEDDADDEFSDQTQDEDDASDEDAEDDSGEEDESPDDEDNEEEDRELSRKVTVTIDGKSERVSLKELRDGYQRQADYSRKTAELAHQRNAFTQETEQVRTEREHYKQVIEAYQSTMAGGVFESMSQEQRAWLKQNDAIEYHNLKDDFEERSRQWQAMEAQKAWIDRQQAEQAQRQNEAILSSEREAMLTKKPEWRDRRVFNKVKSDILQYGKSMGYSTEELSNVTDHRAILALHKLAVADRVASKKAKSGVAIQDAPKRMPLGNAQPTKSRRDTELRKSKQRLATTGSVRDAASIIERLL